MDRRNDATRYYEDLYNSNIRNINEYNSRLDYDYNKKLDYMNEVFSVERENKKEINSRREFNKKLKSSLLSECIMYLFDKSFNTIYSEDTKFYNLKKSLVNNLIDDYGTENMLRRFKYGSDFLAEVCYLVESTYEILSEKCSKDGDCYTIDPVERDDFFSNLNMSNVDKITEKIRSKVESSIEDFILANTADKEKIKEILQNTNDKINNASSEEAKQESASLGKQLIKKIERKPKSIFNSLVYNLAETAMKDPELLEKYKTSQGKLDMDQILETAKITYTFLEMLNTAKLVDKNYLFSTIKEILK